MRDECSASPDHSLKVISTSGAPSGHKGYWYWEAPPGTRIVSVDVEAKLRRDEGHKARLYVADSLGQPIENVATGTDGAASFEAEHWAAPPGSNGAVRFYAALVCDNNGASCPVSPEAKTFVRHVELTLRDVSAPTVTLDGDAVEPGWKRLEVLLKADGHRYWWRVDLAIDLRERGVVESELALFPSGAGRVRPAHAAPCLRTALPRTLSSIRPPLRFMMVRTG